MKVRVQDPPSGSLLIMSLWLVVILAVLAVAVARSLSVDVRLAKYRQAHDQARALARSGVYLALQRLARDAQAPEEGGGPQISHHAIQRA